MPQTFVFAAMWGESVSRTGLLGSASRLAGAKQGHSSQYGGQILLDARHLLHPDQSHP
jgi:hypothetical protein